MITITAGKKLSQKTPVVGEVKRSETIKTIVLAVDGDRVTTRATAAWIDGQWLAADTVLGMSARSVAPESLIALHMAQRLFTEPCREQLIEDYYGVESEYRILLSGDGQSYYLSVLHPLEPQLEMILNWWPWAEMSWKDGVRLGAHLRKLYGTMEEGSWTCSW